MVEKLPIFSTTLAVYKMTLANAGYGMRIAVPWLVIVIAAQYALAYVSAGFIGHLLMFLLYGLAWASIAVRWHRRLLRNEALKGLPLRLDGRSWRYLVWLFWISFIILVVWFLISIVNLPIVLLLSQSIADVESFSPRTELPPLLEAWLHLCLMAACGIGLRLSASLFDPPIGAVGWGMAVIQALLAFGQVLIGITLLSLAYARLVDNKMTDAVSASI